MTVATLAGTSVPPLVQALADQFDGHSLAHQLGMPLSAAARGHLNRALREPLEAFVGHPGKELRSRLVQMGFTLGGGQGNAPPLLGVVVEALHAGSLIVDDIEDGSQTRRGRPALHVTHGVPVALNAGNWLYFWPLELIEQLAVPTPVRHRMRQAMVQTLVQAHHGQALDVSVKVTQLPQAEVWEMVNLATSLKTGALAALATGLGAMAAGADPRTQQAVAHFGRGFGVGLQMLDDRSGICSNASRHKGTEDLRMGRLTWAWAWLAGALTSLQFEQLRVQHQHVMQDNGSAQALMEAMRPLLEPVARASVRTHLRRQLLVLRSALDAPHAVAEIEKDIQMLEASYG